MKNKILDNIKCIKYDSIFEVTPGNIIIGHGIINSVMAEIHYIYNSDIFFQHLIDDVWYEEIIWNDYDTYSEEKHIVYICHPNINIEIDEIIIEDELNLSVHFSKIKKYFIPLSNFIRNKFSDNYLFFNKNLIKTLKINKNLNSPLFSIITSVFNNANQLEQTIQSVINQNSNEFEYIIKDAGSNDNFFDIIKKYQPYINNIISEPDKGVYYGMHEGIVKSKGKFIACLNSDDVFASPHILKNISKVINSQQADAFYGNIEMIRDNQKIFRKSSIERLNIEMSIYHPALFISRKSYFDINGFNFEYRIAADLDLIFRLLQNNITFVHIDKVISIFRLGGISEISWKTLKEELRIRWNHDKYNINGFFYIILRTIKHLLIDK